MIMLGVLRAAGSAAGAAPSRPMAMLIRVVSTRRGFIWIPFPVAGLVRSRFERKGAGTAHELGTRVNQIHDFTMERDLRDRKPRDIAASRVIAGSVAPWMNHPFLRNLI